MKKISYAFIASIMFMACRNSDLPQPIQNVPVDTTPTSKRLVGLNHTDTVGSKVIADCYRFIYNSEGKLRKMVLSDSLFSFGDTTGRENITFEYSSDNVTKQSVIKKGSLAYTFIYEYDSLNRLIKSTQNYINHPTITSPKIINYNYDTFNRVLIDNYGGQLQYADNLTKVFLKRNAFEVQFDGKNGLSNLLGVHWLILDYGFGYDEHANFENYVSSTDPNDSGIIYSYTYDESENPLTKKEADFDFLRTYIYE